MNSRLKTQSKSHQIEMNRETYLENLLKQELQNLQASKRITTSIPKERNVINKTKMSLNKPGTTKTSKTKPENKRIESEREPWSQMLLCQKSRENVSTFGSFDPLRTLHFLTKELQMKLQTSLPDDVDIQQMVLDIQHALKRVPPEVASMVQLNQKSHPIHNLPDEKDKIIRVIKPITSDKQSQTLNGKAEEEEEDKLARLVEEGTVKIEENFKQMEMLCENLKIENNELLLQLDNEKDSNKINLKRMEFLETENNQFTTKIKRLQEENDKLLDKFNDLKMNRDKNYEDAKTRYHEMHIEKTRFEQECASLKHHIAILEMEREKHLLTIATRDKEVNEIKQMISDIQNEINHNVLVLHEAVAPNVPPKQNIEDGVNEKKTIADTSLSSIATNESGRKLSPIKPSKNVEESQKVTKMNGKIVTNIPLKIRRAYHEITNRRYGVPFIMSHKDANA